MLSYVSILFNVKIQHIWYKMHNNMLIIATIINHFKIKLISIYCCFIKIKFSLYHIFSFLNLSWMFLYKQSSRHPPFQHSMCLWVSLKSCNMNIETAIGLQTLINITTTSIKSRGLMFNALKTTRVTFGNRVQNKHPSTHKCG